MERPKLRERVETRVATVLDRRLVDRLMSAGSGPTPSVARWLSLALATLVHLGVLGLLGGGLGLLALGSTWVLRLVGLVVLLPVLALVGPRTRPDANRVERHDAPAFTALVAEVASALGTRAPTHLGIDDGINAHAYRGLRGRTLVVGAPLWVALSPQARVALLGHELGHFARRDVVHGRYVGTAMLFLRSWVRASTPEPSMMSLGHTPLTATIATWPMRALSTSYLRLLWWVNAAASRRAELLADTAAAAVAGTPAVLESLRTLLAVETIERAVNRAAVDPRRPDPAEEIRTRVAALDESDLATVIAGTDEASRVDRTHPPTAERLRLQEGLPPTEPGLLLDPARVAAIDAELQPLLDAALRRMADRYR